MRKGEWEKWVRILIPIVVSFGIGIVVWWDIVVAQARLWTSDPADAFRFAWFSRLEITKAVVLLVAAFLGLIGAALGARPRTED